MQLFGQLGQRTLTMHGHIGDYISFNEAVFMGYTLHYIILMLIEKLFQ
jgi:hypothetical protein